jgi:hypothetical protein
MGGEGSLNCEKCAEVPDEPLRKVYFPEECRSYLLSEVIAFVIGVEHEHVDSDVSRDADHEDVDGVDGVYGDSSARRSKNLGSFGAAMATIYRSYWFYYYDSLSKKNMYECDWMIAYHPRFTL